MRIDGVETGPPWRNMFAGSECKSGSAKAGNHVCRQAGGRFWRWRVQYFLCCIPSSCSAHCCMQVSVCMDHEEYSGSRIAQSRPDLFLVVCFRRVQVDGMGRHISSADRSRPPAPFSPNGFPCPHGSRASVQQTSAKGQCNRRVQKTSAALLQLHSRRGWEAVDIVTWLLR